MIRSRANPDGTQTIEDTGPLTRKRMETIDDETVAAAIDFIERQHTAGKPFFCWWNATRMHFRTHVKQEHTGLSGKDGDEYHDGMVEHDMHVGQLLDLLDDLGIADNTVVMYSTDNGPHYNTWPDAGTTPFRSEKNSNWEGAYRVPIAVRWPGKIPAGQVSNGIAAHQDWLPTLLAVHFLSMNSEQVSHESVNRAHRNRKGVHVWTVNDRVSALRMIEMGVDNLITDEPEMIVTLRSEWCELSQAELIALALRTRFLP